MTFIDAGTFGRRVYPFRKYGASGRLRADDYDPWVIAQAVAEARFALLNAMIKDGQHSIEDTHIEVTVHTRAVSNDVPDHLQFPSNMHHVVYTYDRQDGP